MFNNFAKLKTYKFDSNVTYFHPGKLYDIIYEDTPALQVFTDFQVTPPLTVKKSLLVNDALNIMHRNNVKGLLVSDEKERVLGFISALSIGSKDRIQIAEKNNVKPKNLTVDLLMLRTEDLIMVDYNDLSNARVGHIAKILRNNSLTHLLVFEKDKVEKEETIIRGIFSSSRISKQIGKEIGHDRHLFSVSDLSKIFE